MTLKKKARRPAEFFTLIELLVVIAIIAVLAGMLIPSLGKAKMRARSIACAGNERQLYPALMMYTDDFDDFLPGNAPVLGGYYMPRLLTYLKSPEILTDCRAKNAPESVEKEYAADGARNVSYGASIYTLSWDTYCKRSEISKPQKKIVFGDSQTAKQSGSSLTNNAAFAHYSGYYLADFSSRHGGEVNFLFADGHMKPLPNLPGGPGGALAYYAHFVGINKLLSGGVYDYNKSLMDGI